jgi:hypothetical protein
VCGSTYAWYHALTLNGQKKPAPGRVLGIAKKSRSSSHAKKAGCLCNLLFFPGLIVIDALLKLA